MLIAVDADGGDYAPREIVKGAAEAAKELDIDIALVGRKVILEMLVRRYSKKGKLSIIESSQVIDYSEPPVQAIRNKPDSSIVVGVTLVKEKKADAFVSAGNTGAVLAAGFMLLDRIEGIKRPALCGIIHVLPTNPVLLVDAGANVDCQPHFLVQFAQLGSVFARGFLRIEMPRVALLNNGSEETKGNQLIKESYQLLKNVGNINFIGNIEGQDILRGKADVIVTDGFSGNIVLKTMEGFADMFNETIGLGKSSRIDKDMQGSTLVHYVELTTLIKRMDYKEYGGACLLGVNGNIIVAHGRSHAKAIKNAIRLARRTVEANVIDTLKENSSTIQEISNNNPTGQ
jgi:phosphate acyltransferase